MGIRTKVLSGFLILACMLFLAGVWSVHELTTIGSSVQGLLDDNYRSVNAARIMIEALEREDSAILLIGSGNGDEGRKILESADTSFQEGFRIARKNITIPGESAYVEQIKNAYGDFKDMWIKPVSANFSKESPEWYFNDIHPKFLVVKSTVEKLMSLNDTEMYQTASNLKNRAHRAVMPGLVALLAALVFSFLFNYFVNYYLVGPIIRITTGIQAFIKNGEPFAVKIETDDELKSLTTSIRELAERH